MFIIEGSILLIEFIMLILVLQSPSLMTVLESYSLTILFLQILDFGLQSLFLRHQFPLPLFQLLLLNLKLLLHQDLLLMQILIDLGRNGFTCQPIEILRNLIEIFPFFDGITFDCFFIVSLLDDLKVSDEITELSIVIVVYFALYLVS